jgi:hypothetical protein
MFGPLIKTEHYKSRDSKELHGMVAYYSAEGFLDSTGTYANGKKEGDFWKITDDSLKLKWEWKYVYRDDKLIETIDDTKENKEEYIYDSSNPENTIGRPEIQSVYPGGDNAWQKYLYKNFKYPDRAINNSGSGLDIIRRK